MNNEKELDYQKKKEEIIKFLESKHAIILATSHNNRVTARTVTFASKELDIYFMSWEHHTKCLQIRENPRVALCRDNVQIEGLAEILGSPLDEKNREYAEIYRNKVPRDFEGFASQPGMILVKVTPISIVSMVNIDNWLYLEHLDIENEKAWLTDLAE